MDDQSIIVTDITPVPNIVHSIQVPIEATATLLTQFLPMIDAQAPVDKVPQIIVIQRNKDGSSQIRITYISL